MLTGVRDIIDTASRLKTAPRQEPSPSYLVPLRSTGVQVVPPALLEFSRSVLREKFSAVVRKSVYTFEYDRFQKSNNYALYRKLLKARDSKGIIIATDTSVKAFQLKFIEILHQLDRLQTAGMLSSPRGTNPARGDCEEMNGFCLCTSCFSLQCFSFVFTARDSNDSRALRFAEMFFDQLGDRKTAHKVLKEQAPLLHEQVDIAVRALEILRAGAVIVDEVDMILHPLRRYGGGGRCLFLFHV